MSLELSKLYMLTEDLDACQQQCMTLLKEDKVNDAATMVSDGRNLTSQIMFSENVASGSSVHNTLSSVKC